MASNRNSSFSRDQFLCSICLEVLVQPVSTPCGHNFCMNCIETYWDSSTDYHCPVCRESLKDCPDLKVNSFIAEAVRQFQLQKLSERQVGSPVVEATAVGGHDSVYCDICPGNTTEAFMSCVQCRKSYCYDHLKSHETSGTLRAHTLVAPLDNPEGFICQEHKELHRHFCRDDGQLLCDKCAAGHHARHSFVPVEKACQKKRLALVQIEAKALMMMDERRQRVEVLKEEMTQNRAKTRDLLGKFERSFTKLLCELQQVQDQLANVTQEMQEDDERQSGKMITSIEKEIVQLKSAVDKVQKLKNGKNQLPMLLQEDVALPFTTDLQVKNRSTLIQDIRESLKAAVSKMQECVRYTSAELEEVLSTGCQTMTQLQDLLRYQEDITLDPNTAHPKLVVSKDRKRVSFTPIAVFVTPQKHKATRGRFTQTLAILGTRGFFGQKFYFQVFVGRKKEWIVGVATASIDRDGDCRRGVWAIYFRVDSFQESFSNRPVHSGKVELVGVFVDYYGSKVSFYDVQTEKLIYSFTNCRFREELFPFFNPCDNELPNNLDPMVIMPVSPTDA